MHHRAKIQAIAATTALGAFIGTAVLSSAGEAPAQQATNIKALMGENFGGLQTILYSLISANYAPVPEQADVIRQHAEELGGVIPDSAKADREKFLAYANNLAVHAQDMKTIAQTLMEHDRARSVSSTDYLREALASHYGGMVTTCVACHNRFRPLPVK